MSVDRHPDWFATVRDNWRKTAGFLLASREPCLGIRDDELDAIRGNRVLVGFGPDDLDSWTPPASWLLAAILCPGDDVRPLVLWTKRHRADTARIAFFLHADTDVEVLRPWKDAGFATDRVDVVASWRELHKLLGLALNDRVYADWARAVDARR